MSKAKSAVLCRGEDLWLTSVFNRVIETYDTAVSTYFYDLPAL